MKNGMASHTSKKNSNLVPRAFPLKMGGAGKGPGNGWSRVLFPPHPYPDWELGTGKTAKQS